MCIDVEFWGDSSRGLESFVTASFVGKSIFFVIDPQNCFVQNQQILNVLSSSVVTTNPVIDD